MFIILITTMIIFIKMNSYRKKDRYIVVPLATKNIYDDNSSLEANFHLDMYTFYKKPYRSGFKRIKKEPLTNNNVKNIKKEKKEKKFGCYNYKQIRKKV